MTLQGAFRLWLLDILFPFPQSVSPGLVRTEFLGRASNAKDLEQSKKYYDKICAEVHHNYTLLLNFNSKLHCTVSVVFTDCIQVLEAEDIASAILYTLSTPPRMQVSLQFLHQAWYSWGSCWNSGS